jgi:2-iminobutanoate/2-iminopropanoate deaminase
MQQIIHTAGAPSPIGPYAQAVRAGGFVFVSGQIPLDPATGAVVDGAIAEQTRRVMQNLKAILEAAGSGLHKVVKTTLYLKDLADFAGCNAVYGDFLGEAKPARATVQAARLPKDVLLEVDAVALA